MAKYLKEGKSLSEIQEHDQKVYETVRGIIENVGKHGDKAVRDLSQQFDRWSPEQLWSEVLDTAT